VKEATVIIPLYRQGRECLAGDPEACGGIAALALGLVKEGGRPLVQAEFEEAAIRSAIERPRAGDPAFAEAFEKPTPRGEVGQRAKTPGRGRTEPPAAAQPRDRAPAGRTAAPGAKAAPGAPAVEGLAEAGKAVERFAGANHISLGQLKADLVELHENVREPGQVRRPADPRFDAEISTSANGERHTFDREKPAPGHEGEPRTWCRRSQPPGACGLRVDPEVNKMVDDALEESEGGQSVTRAAPPREKTLKADEYRKTKAAAKKEFKHGPKHIGTQVSRHRDAPAVREGEGVSGRNVQSAHVAPSSFMKSLDDYLRDEAHTMLQERGKHFSFDQVWKDWAQDQRRLGRDEVTVQELHGVMAEAIERAPLTDAEKSALFTLLHDELFQIHKLTPEDTLPLPYRNVPALKPGPERTALRGRYAAREKAREQAHIRHTISVYERIAKDLDKSGNKARAQMYRLEIEKLKKQLKK
jgi:hypothetical protein